MLGKGNKHWPLLPKMLGCDAINHHQQGAPLSMAYPPHYATSIFHSIIVLFTAYGKWTLDLKLILSPFKMKQHKRYCSPVAATLGGWDCITNWNCRKMSFPIVTTLPYISPNLRTLRTLFYLSVLRFHYLVQHLWPFKVPPHLGGSRIPRTVII